MAATQLRKPAIAGETILRRAETCAATGLPISSLYAMVSRGQFPAPIKLSLRRVGWLKGEVDRWIAHRIDQSRRTKLIEGYAGATVLLHDANARIVLGQEVDISALSQVLNSLVKIGSRLGLRRRLKDVTPDLQQYLEARARQVNDDDAELEDAD